MTDAPRDIEVTFDAGEASADEVRQFVAEELWAEDLLDSSPPVLDLLEEAGELVEEVLVLGDGEAQAQTSLGDGSVDLTVVAVTSTTREHHPFDPDLLETSLIDVIERRADQPRPVERLTVRIRVARRFRRVVRSESGAPRRRLRAGTRRRRSPSRRRGSPQ